MPRLISIPQDSQWKSAEFEADFTDASFGFLGTFEEILPDEIETTKKTKKTKKTAEEGETTEDGTKSAKKRKDKNKKLKRKKQKARKALKESETQEEAGEETGDTVEGDEAEKAEPEIERKAKKTKKDKKEVKRKVQFDETATEESAPAKKKKKVAEKKAKKDTKTTVPESSEEVTKKASEDPQPKTEEKDISEWLAYDLPEEINKAIKNLGFSTPTEIQSLVLRAAVRDRLDILGAAETGSGKTLAFAIPMLSRLLTGERVGNGPRGLVIAPTRELVVQIMKTFNALCKFTKLTAYSIVGGLAEAKQQRVMKQQKPEILVGTPGRLWDLIKQAEPDSYLGDFSGLECLVIDETDRMVEQGHFREMQTILSHVRSASTFAANDKLQTLVFSATLTYVVPETTTKNKEMNSKEKINYLVELTGMRKHHRVVDITREFGTAEKLVETRLNCTGLLDKDTYLVYLLTRYRGRTLVFTNSVDASRRLYGVLTNLNFKPLMLHANMIQRQRLRNLEKFSSEKESILLATDVAARGLDIKGIEHVIHYQVPKTAEMYIHRSGRTARASEKGLTVLMVDPKDAFLYKKLCRNLNRETDLPVFPIDCDQLLSALENRVKIASELDTVQFRAKKIKLHETWFEKAAREADLCMDHREKDINLANTDMDNLLRKQDTLRAQLRVAMAMKLPDTEILNKPKTRYITPQLASNYGKTLCQDALENFNETIAGIKEMKKRSRTNIKTHNIKGRQFKRK